MHFVNTATPLLTLLMDPACVFALLLKSVLIVVKNKGD